MNFGLSVPATCAAKQRRGGVVLQKTPTSSRTVRRLFVLLCWRLRATGFLLGTFPRQKRGDRGTVGDRGMRKDPRPSTAAFEMSPHPHSSPVSSPSARRGIPDPEQTLPIPEHEKAKRVKFATKQRRGRCTAGIGLLPTQPVSLSPPRRTFI